MHYHITRKGNFHVLMLKHRRNQEWAMLGGRFEANDAQGYSTLADALWHVTIFREIREELGMDDWEILAPMMEGQFDHFGTTLWKHHKTNQVCVDFVAGIRCKRKFMPVIPDDSEIEAAKWVPWPTRKASSYLNVELALELMYDKIFGTPFAPYSLNYEPSQFEQDELGQVCLRLNRLLGNPEES